MECQQKCEGLCEKFWEWRILNFPEFATLIGEHKYDDKLNDMSLEGYKQKHMEANNILLEVKELLKVVNSQSLRSVDLELLYSDLKTYVSGFAYKSYLCPINLMEGPHLYFCEVLGRMRRETTKDFDNILARLTLFPKQIDQVIGLMKEGIRQNITLHEHSTASVPTLLRNCANQMLTDSPYYKHFQHRPKLISEIVWVMLREKAESVILTRVFPVLVKLATFISDHYINFTRREISINTTALGNRVYDVYLKYHTSTNKTAEDIHQLGLKEVHRVKQRILKLKEQMGFAGSFQEFQMLLQSDQKSHFSNEKEILTTYSLIMKRIAKELHKVFRVLPYENCLIRPIPKEQAKTAPGAFYKAGNEHENGVFYVNSSNVSSRRKYTCVALALHEGIPGHHLQSDLFLHQYRTAKFRKHVEGGNYCMIPARFPLHTAYMEGWALYAEHLGEELDLLINSSDLYGKLRSEMLRAVRLVVDTGIHAFEWERKDAIDYILDHIDCTTQFATSEVDRYITWPGQACSYKIGELQIHDLRRLTKASLGETFDIKEFHDIILSFGSVPLYFIHKKIQEYINIKLKMI